MSEVYDTLILGAGSAGLGAAIYAARYSLKLAVIGLEPGGLLNEAHLVENYAGFKSINGRELMDKFREHVKYFDVPIFEENITDIKKNDNIFEVVTDKNTYTAKTLIIALGSQRRRLDVKGAKEFSGRGVSYCFTCDAPFYKSKDAVGIVGGSDSAAMASLLLADYAKKVYIIYRKEKMRCQPIYFSEMAEKGNIEFIYNANVTEILGDKKLESVKLDTGKELKLDGLFVEIGQIPNTDLPKKLGVELDERGYIKKDEFGQTNIPGVFTAGDISTTPLRQVVVGAGEGAIAALSVYGFVNKIRTQH